MSIDKTYQLPFPAQRVYAAWVSSKTVVPPATGMDIHPVVDGHYRLIMETPDFTARAEGVFLIVEPDEHIVGADSAEALAKDEKVRKAYLGAA